MVAPAAQNEPSHRTPAVFDRKNPPVPEGKDNRAATACDNSSRRGRLASRNAQPSGLCLYPEKLAYPIRLTYRRSMRQRFLGCA